MREYIAIIQQEISTVTSIPSNTLDLETPFSGFGIDSLQAVTIAANLSKKLNRELPLTVFFDYPTIRNLADFLAGKAESPKTLDEHSAKQDPIAIIGLACRFPGANNASEFWNNLILGKDAIREVPSSRWDYKKFADLPALRWGGFLENIEAFDAEMFGISEVEATHMDPQQKLLLECVHEALENAGITATRLNRSATGVFIGISSSDYSNQKIRSGKNANVLDAIGNSHSIASNRISYIYNLKGPSLSIDTACSSSLVALHKACQSIQSGECDLAIVGGVNILLDPQISVAFANAGMLAPDGHCKTFSKEANGYVRGEGCGVIVLQRASLAKMERSYAIIRGTAVNHDGKTNGLTAPSGPAQEEVIRTALHRADLLPSDIDFIEAHGTGTSLGDPIEFLSLAKIFSPTEEKKKVAVGSAKAFIGHLEAAAGIAGIIKTALALKQRQWMKQIYFTSINPKMESALQQLDVIIDSKRLANDKIYYAGISSFGFGGTNAHAILASAPFFETVSSQRSKSNLFLSLSATNKDSLRSTVEFWQKKLPHLSVEAIQRSNQERLEYRERICFYGNQDSLEEAILAWQSGNNTQFIQRDVPKAYQARLAFVLPCDARKLVPVAFFMAETETKFSAIWQECLAYFEGYFPRALTVSCTDSWEQDVRYQAVMQFAARYSIIRFLYSHYELNPEAIIVDRSCSLAVAAGLQKVSLAEASKRVMLNESGQDFLIAGTSSLYFVSEDSTSLEQRIEEAKERGVNSILVIGDSALPNDERIFKLCADWPRAIGELAIRKLVFTSKEMSGDALPSTAFYHRNSKASLNLELNMENTLLSELQSLVADLLHVTAAEVDPDTNLIDLGADSLLLLSAIQTIKERHGVSIAVADLFRNLNTLRAICQYVLEHKAKPKTATDAPVISTSVSSIIGQEETRKVVAAMNAEAMKSSMHLRGDLQSIIESQLALMHSQLQLLGGAATVSVPPQATLPKEEPASAKVIVEAKGVLGNWKAKANRDVSAEEQSKEKYIKEFISKFNARTPKSKQHTQKYRKYLADNRVSAGFRPNLKEMIYTIIFESGKGSHFLDLDGNDYIDFTMGFGVNLFGHCPDFVEDRIRKQLDIGYCVGPQAELAGIVAEKACKVVQHERIAFLNSGTEAVMTAIRLARTVSGRNRIVIFEGSYHGHADVVLARAAAQGGTSLPVAPGVPTGIVGDVVVLPYGEQSSIEYIRKHGDSLAAVLVEPVQSRYPEHQPIEFLRELRKITEKSGSAFIFDEVICGLRVAPAGAEQLFQIKPDISVYGKILGGGMPIGAVAGFAKYLDPIDGGNWRFGDDSYPSAEMTFFAGTFCKHPVTMAAADAVMDRFLLEGDSLTKNLNARTTSLCERINKEFQGYDIQANNFGSLFRFKSPSNIDLLFANMNYRGAYIWEGRNLFLSTAHTQKDEDDFIQIIRGSMDELTHEGFLRKK